MSGHDVPTLPVGFRTRLGVFLHRPFPTYLRSYVRNPTAITLPAVCTGDLTSPVHCPAADSLTNGSISRTKETRSRQGSNSTRCSSVARETNHRLLPQRCSNSKADRPGHCLVGEL